MPKLKTNSSAKKRFKKTANGFCHKQPGRRHLQAKLSAGKKRQRCGNVLVEKSDEGRMAQMMP